MRLYVTLHKLELLVLEALEPWPKQEQLVFLQRLQQELNPSSVKPTGDEYTKPDED